MTLSYPPGTVHCSGTYLEFHREPAQPQRKTATWQVRAKNGAAIGRIAWFSRWRKYCFFPLADTVYEEVCLGEIAQFLVTATGRHKQARTALTESPSS